MFFAPHAHYVDTTVMLRDENNDAVLNATVELFTILPDSSIISKSRNTGENGTATFYVHSRLEGEFISVVNEVSHSSYVYEPAANNVETICSLVLP